MDSKAVAARPRAVAVWLCLLATLVGCGSAEDPSRLADDGEEPSLLSVVMAGNDSCKNVDGTRWSPRGASFYPNFAELIEKLKASRQIRVDYIVSCYSLRAGLFVANSDAPEVVESIDEQALPDYIRRFHAAHADREMLWIGHSYGGWLAMKTLLALLDDTQLLPRTGLFTIDPISKRRCSVLRPRGCSSAPTDISEPEYLRLGASVGEWVNFFQRKTPVVRSSAIKGARSNIQIDAGHTWIDNHPEVWSSIEAGFQGYAARDAGAWR